MNFITRVANIVVVMAFFLMPKLSVLAVEIKDFQPAVVPIRSVTTLNVATAGHLNANSTIQCRFNDMSMPAELKGSMVFCNTPPMRQIDKAVLHLEVDGKLFKAKRQLRLHEPFKVTDISPKIASPSEQLTIQVSGITCEKWMTFYVRFQTANGTKRTQKGICDNSTVTCYIPEFPAHALLRVGVTLSNRIVEWSPTKLRIQYPVDSIKSSLKDLQPNTKRRGAFTFKLLPRDKFQNPISDKGISGSDSPLSVQYSPFTNSKEFHFLTCEVSPDEVGSEYGVSCHGAKHERILVYPSINNVPVGGTSSYEVRTTLCPGKTSCDDNSSLIVTVIVSSSVGAVLLVALAVLLYKYRHSLRQKFVPRRIYLDETSMELTERQGNPPVWIENLPESHANETGISSDEKKSDETEITKDKLQNLPRDRLDNEAEHFKEEEDGEIDDLFLSSVENVPGAHVNVALGTEDREDNNEVNSAKEGSTSTEHHPLSSSDPNHEMGVIKPVGLAKEVALEDEDVMENLEMQEVKMSTAELELDEKF